MLGVQSRRVTPEDRRQQLEDTLLLFEAESRVPTVPGKLSDDLAPGTLNSILKQAADAQYRKRQPGGGEIVKRRRKPSRRSLNVDSFLFRSSRKPAQKQPT